MDDDADISVDGQKIKLSDNLQKILKNKILKEFHELNFSTHNDREFAGEFSDYNTSEETKYWKLTLFSSFFDISDNQNQDVREFIIQEVFKDINTYGHREGKIVDVESMTQFLTVLRIIKPYVKFQQAKLINDYYQSTTFTREFSTFYDFKKLFPTEFKIFTNKNIVEIRQKIRSTILDDIDYFQEIGDDLAFDILLDYYIEEVCKTFGVRLTDKFLKEMENLSERSVGILNKRKKAKKLSQKLKKTKKPIKEKKTKKSTINEVIQEYLPNSEYEEINPVSIIKKYSESPNVTKFLLNEVKNENSIFSTFFSKKILIIALVEYLSTIEGDLLFTNQYNLLNSFSQYIFLQNGIDEEIAEKILSELAIKSDKYECYFSHNQLITTLSEQKVSNYEPIQLYPFVIENGNWFTFSSKTFAIYFSVKYAEKIISDEEFRDFIENSYYDEDKMEFLKMLNEVIPERLQNIVILSELNKFVQLINPSSDKDTFLSFLKFFEITMDLELKGKRFENYSSSGANIYLELLLNFIGLEFETMSFDIYFLKDYQYGESIKKFFIKEEYYDDLFKAVTSQNTLKKSRRFWDDKPYKYYEIELYNFAQNDSNYEILKNIGMQKYILSVFSYVSQYLQDAENNLYL